MANKWKYSTLTADERLDRIRSGDEDVYNSEIERSNDVIKQRKEAGLDISAQNNWIDTLNYNYGLSKTGNKAKRNKPITIKSNEVYAVQKVNELFDDDIMYNSTSNMNVEFADDCYYEKTQNTDNRKKHNTKNRRYQNNKKAVVSRKKVGLFGKIKNFFK